MQETECRRKSTERDPLHDRLQVLELRTLRPQKPPPRRRIEKEISYLQSGPRRVGRRTSRAKLATIALDGESIRGFPLP